VIQSEVLIKANCRYGGQPAVVEKGRIDSFFIAVPVDPKTKASDPKKPDNAIAQA
jgi:hypothetical protein